MRNRFTRFANERGGSFATREDRLLEAIDLKRRVRTAPEVRSERFLDAAVLHLRSVDRARAKLAAQVFGEE